MQCEDESIDNGFQSAGFMAVKRQIKTRVKLDNVTKGFMFGLFDDFAGKQMGLLER